MTKIFLKEDTKNHKYHGYYVVDEWGNDLFDLECKINFGNLVHIKDTEGNVIAMVKEKAISLTSCYEMFLAGNKVGTIKKEFHITSKTKYNMDNTGWYLEGSVGRHNYTVKDSNDNVVAKVSRTGSKNSDKYEINLTRIEDMMFVIMFMYVVDREKDEKK